MTMTSWCTGAIVSKVKFTLEPPSQANLIRSYSDGEVRIGEQRTERETLGPVAFVPLLGGTT